MDLTGTALDNYTFSVGPDLLDTNGNAMNQDRDATLGESAEDAYHVTLTAAALTIADGNVSYDNRDLLLDGNTVAVIGNSTLLLRGADTTGQVNAAWAGKGVAINAAGVTVDAGSLITADGQSMSNGRGEGGGSGGSIYVVTQTLTGSGHLSADGGSSLTNRGGGGGGSVRIFPWNSNTVPTSNFTAADGTAAPTTDLMGASRYDDPRSANSGTAMPDGSFAGLGAFEFVEGADADVDLVVASVAGTSAIIAGQNAQVTWTVQNQGSATVTAGWHDRIELVSGNAENGVTSLFVGEVVSNAVSLGPRESSSFAAAVSVPGGTEGPYHWQIKTNSRGEVFEGRQWANNTTFAISAGSLSVPSLLLDTPVADSFAAIGAPVWFKLAQSSGQDLKVVLDSQATAGRSRVYAGFGRMPTEIDFDLRSLVSNSPDTRLALPAADHDRTVYLLVVPESLDGSSLAFTLTASAVTFALDSIGLGTAGNSGQITIPIAGSGLVQGMTARLLPSSGISIDADTVAVADSTSALATFDLRGAAAGIYDLRIDQSGFSDTLLGGFTVTQGVGGRLDAELVLPQLVRIGRPFKGIIRYSNVGDADLPAPPAGWCSMQMASRRPAP